jgi:subtilisin-like proprotein convertase family protein/subtilisin family serine protease
MKLRPAWVWSLTGTALLAGPMSACGGQRGATVTQDPPIDDVSAPVFIHVPELEGIGPDSADVVFSVNEKSEGALVVRQSQPQLALSHDEIAGAADKHALAPKAFETTRVELKDLAPDQLYTIHLTLHDGAGNIIGEPVVKEFRTTPVTVTSALAGTPDVAREGVYWRFAPDGLPAGCQLRLVSAPAWMRIAAAGDAVEGVPVFSVWDQSKDKEEIALAVSGTWCNGESRFTVPTAGDPFFSYAWHLNPGTSRSFAWFAGRQTPGINAQKAYNAGLSGAGVRVTIVDSGLQVNHPDLKKNIDQDANINLEPLLAVNCQICDPKDPTPPVGQGEAGDQGTAVGGIIAAEAWNGIGSRGVAPGVKLSAYNLTAPRFPRVSDDDYLRIFGINSDVICHSGTEGRTVLTNVQQFNFDGYDAAQKRKVTLGRDEKGIVYLKAAGDLGAMGGNAAFDQRNVTSWGMVIGSHNNLDRKSRHASPGANLWISASGGEAGYQSDFDQYPSPKSVLDFYPGLVSTDIFSDEFPCSSGYAKKPQYFQPDVDPAPVVHSIGHSSGFNMSWHPLNKNCAYTATVPRTPAATGVVAGAVALLLEARPDLTWRDVKYVLAKSARPIDSDRAAELTSIRSSVYERTMPWITNAAGYRFHNHYGFGALDVDAALAIVTSDSFRHLPPQEDSTWILAATPAQRIPPASIAGTFSDYFHVKDLLIESVQVRLSISHENIGNLGVELVSPAGTRSILKAVKDGSRIAGMDDMVFLSNAFYGEKSRGLWQLRIVDGKNATQPGYLNNWYFRMTGHKPGGGA